MGVVYVPRIPALRRLKQEEHTFEASLGYSEILFVGRDGGIRFLVRACSDFEFVVSLHYPILPFPIFHFWYICKANGTSPHPTPSPPF